MAVGLVVVIVFMIVSTVIGNTAICYIIYRVRRLHSPSCIFLVNLAINDILVALFLLPFSIATTASNYVVVSKTGCDIIGFFQHATSAVSVLTLLSVSMDRYLAILTPLKYKGWVTRNRTVLCIFFIWFYALLSACYPLLGWSRYYAFPGQWLCESSYHISVSFTYFKMTTIYFMPLVSIIFIYISILRVALRHSKQIAREVKALRQREMAAVLEPELGAQVSAAVISGQYCMRKPHSALRADIKTALTLASIVGVLFIAWTPYIVVNLWSSHTRNYGTELLQSIVSGLYYSTGVINPYLYGYLNRIIKREFKTIWTNTCRSFSQIRANKIQQAEITSRKSS